MATTVDRPQARPPVKQRNRLQKPGWRERPRPPHLPPGSAERRLARFYLASAGGAMLIGLLGLAAVVLAVILSLAPGQIPPATGAAELVPGNALLYLHVSTDTSRPAVRQALILSRRLPGSPLLLAALTNRLDGSLSASGGVGISYDANVRPWLGREAALAVLDTPGSSAGSLIVLDVRNRAAARRFLGSAGARPAGLYRGVPLLKESSGTVLALLRHYLVLGQPSSVRAAIDVASGRVRSLAASGRYQGAAAAEPADRVLDAYASADGIRRALEPRSGWLGALGILLDQPALSGATISISPDSSGLRIDVRRVFDPALMRPREPSVGFGPSLAALLPASSPLLLEFHGLRASAPKLLAAAAKAGIAARLAPLLTRLGSALAAQGVNLRQVLGVFSGETALALTPGSAGAGPAPVLITRPAHPAQARELLAGLEVPLTQVFAAAGNGPGQVPELNDATVDGVAVHQLSLAPGFGLDYALAHGLVIMSTESAGIARVLAHRRGLDQAHSFNAVTATHPDQVTSLLFSNLSQLLRLGEQAGLIGAPRQTVLWPTVERIRAVGLTSWPGANDDTTKLQIQIP